MLALKKFYGDELIRLALILSLIKTNSNDLLENDIHHLTAGLNISNGTDWSIENESRTLIRPTYVHPKSIDNILVNHERYLFDELNSLGRYYGLENNDRMSNTNRGPVVHTYVLNNVATDTSDPSIDSVEPALNNDEEVLIFDQDGVSDDANVGQEVKVSDEESQEASAAEAVVTLSPDFFNNRTQSDIFAELATRSFDVTEFLISPDEMQVKKEPEDETEQDLLYKIKKESDNDDLFSDNAIDYVPFFARSEDFKKVEPNTVIDQNMADLQDYGELFEDVKNMRGDLEYLDVKQQHDNLEQYLLENTPLDAEVYELAPIFEEELVLDVKRERASTSFTSSSSSGVSEMDVGAEEVATEVSDVKTETDEGNHSGDELTQEDMDLIEVLWKQDVDMGFCLESPVELEAPQATKVELHDEIDKELKLAAEKIQEEEQRKQNDIEKVKKSLLDADDKEEDPWAGLSYTVDTETGEYVLQGELPRELVSNEEPRFDLLEEALQLVVLGDEEQPKDEESTTPSPVEGAAATEEPPAAMLHPAMARHHIPHHHPLAHYHNQSLMRSMSVEQRWQDLASLLTIPPPPDQYPYSHHPQHPHNISAHGPPGGYAPNYGPIAPTADKHPEVYGGAVPLDNAYKVESAHHPQQHDAIYYQNGGAPEIPNSDGFLQSILNDEDLQLMDMAMNEGMYTMRMLDGSAAGAAHAHPAPPHLNQSHMMITERDSASDSAVSSMGSERVPSLSDSEWCDAGSDSAQEYHSSKFRPYDASFGRDRPTPVATQAPQKKHHMFGKRCFQEPQQSNLEPLVPEAPRAQTVIKYEYPEQTHHPYHPENAMAIPNHTEFRHQAITHQPHLSTLQPALDLNPGHTSHTLLQSRYAGAAAAATVGATAAATAAAGYLGERVRHNHTYSAPLLGLEPRPAARDKRVRRLTDGSMSDASSTANSNGHLSRDEKRAKALGIPMEVTDIINLPMDEFNERLSKHDLSEAQLSLIRDIRRRGKNKVAAQNCRKRKLDQITSLADEVRTVRDRKVRTQRDHQSLQAERQRVKERFAALYRHVFQNLRDAEGRPLASAQYSLQQAADGNVVLVPKMTQGNDHSMNRTSDKDLERKSKNFDQ